MKSLDIQFVPIIAAALTLAAFSASADAAIVYSDTVSFSITGGAIPSATMPITGFTDIFAIIQYPGYMDPYDGDSYAYGFLDGANPGKGAVSVTVNLNDVISSSTNGWESQTFIGTNGIHYLAIAFNNVDTTNYGWMKVSTSNYNTTSSSPNFTLLSYAYENTGASITVGNTGAVPEPSAFALLGLGALGLVSRRKR